MAVAACVVSGCSEEADADADGVKKESEGWEEGEEGEEEEGGSRRARREARRAALRVCVERRARLRDLVACSFRRSWRIDSGVGAEAGVGRVRFCRLDGLGQPANSMIGWIETPSRRFDFPLPPPSSFHARSWEATGKNKTKNQQTS